MKNKSIFTLIVITVLFSCTKVQEVINKPTPLYIMAADGKYHTSTDDRVSCSGIGGLCCFASMPPKATLSVGEMGGIMTAALYGKDSVKISKVFDQINITEASYANQFKLGYIDYKTASSERDDMLLEVYKLYNISGFPEKIIVPASKVNLKIIGGQKPAFNKYIYEENLYIGKNGGARREIIITPK